MIDRGKSEALPSCNTLKEWLFTTNHKKVGILYLVTSFIFLFIAGAFAEIMRTQLYSPNSTFLNAAEYNQLVTMHGLLMILFFISPMGFAFANYFVPIQIGAKDMAFPRLNALSYWMYLFGGILLLSGFLLPGGALSGGWTLYAPLNEVHYLPQAGEDAGIAGITMLGISLIVSTVNFAVTIALKRAKGMSLLDMPMFTWSILFTVAMLWIVFPEFAGALVLLLADRIIGSVVFLSPVGGALLWEQMFWFMGHPEVYVLLLPALGAMFDVASVFSGKAIYAKKLMIGSFATIFIMSMLVFMHHMFMTGVNLVWLEIQEITTELISIPSGVLIIGIIATMLRGRIKLRTPVLFTIGAVIVFIIGGATGVMQSSIELDTAFNGDYWVIAHFHYILAGTVLWGLYAALYFWFPKLTGKMYSERLGVIHFVFSFIGLNLTFAPMFWLLNMPRRYYTYPSGLGFTLPNEIATAGALFYGFSQLLPVLNILYSTQFGDTAEANPWGAYSLEWLIPTPVPEFNFTGTPCIVDGKFIMDSKDASKDEHGTSGHLSPWPLAISLGMFLSFLGLVLFLYGDGNAVLAAGLMIFTISAFGWMIDDYYNVFPEVEKDGVSTKETWPFRHMDSTRLGMWIFVSGDILLFTTFISASLFIFLQSQYFGDPATSLRGSAVYDIISIMVLIASIGSMYAAAEGAKRGNREMTGLGLLLTFFFGLCYIASTLIDWSYLNAAGSGLGAISGSALLSIFYDSSIVHIVHIIGGLALVIYFFVKNAGNRIAERSVPSMYALLYFWSFIAVAGVIMIGTFAMI